MNRIEACLTEWIRSGEIPHALLFCGPKGEAKQEAAYRFARQLMGSQKKIDSHPDIHLYFPEGKVGMHSIDSLRKLMHDVALVPFQGSWKVFIIHEAEKMLPTSSQALLKTLEEPSERTVIILLTHHAERILPTLASRCCTIWFPALQQPKLSSELLNVLTLEWNETLAKALENEEPEDIFNAIMCWYRDRYVLEIGGQKSDLHFPEAIESIKKTPLIPLDIVEKRLKEVRLAYDRSAKLSFCLEIFFLAMRVA